MGDCEISFGNSLRVPDFGWEFLIFHTRYQHGPISPSSHVSYYRVHFTVRRTLGDSYVRFIIYRTFLRPFSIFVYGTFRRPRGFSVHFRYRVIFSSTCTIIAESFQNNTKCGKLNFLHQNMTKFVPIYCSIALKFNVHCGNAKRITTK